MNSVAIPASASAPVLSAEADLVRSAARGDAGAFEELFRRHSEPAWRLAQAVAPDGDAARDALRGGFARALRSARTPRRHSGHPPVFRAEVLAAVYKSAVEQAHDRSAAPTARRPHPDATLALTDAAFRSLPERWRAAVWLSEVENMDVERMAPILGVSSAVASQLMIRGKRGLAGRFSQAGHEVPEHLGQLLRALSLPTPAKLMEDTQTRFAAAGAERGPVLAPVAGWLEDRAVRPMSVAVGALVGLGLIGLGVVPQGSALRSQLGASAAGSLAGAVPVQTCLGLPCSGGAGTTTTAGNVLGITGGSTVAGLLGGAGGFGSNPGGSASSGGSASGSAGGSAASTPLSGGAPAVTTSAGGTTSPAPTGTQTSGGGSNPSSPGGSSTSPKQPSQSTVISAAPVATVTSSGSALNVNLLPTSSGTAAATGTVGGCSTLVGVTAGSTTVGCSPTGSSTTSTGGTTSSGSSNTSSSGTDSTSTSSTSGGLSTTTSGTTSTVGNTLNSTTSGL